VLLWTLRDVTARRRMDAELTRNARLATIAADVAAVTGRPSGVDAILRECVELMTRELGLVGAAAWTLDEHGELHLRAAAGPRRLWRNPPALGRIRWVTGEERSYRCESIAGDLARGERAVATATGVVALAAYPLLAGARLIGALALYGAAPFDEATYGACATIATQIAMGIARAEAEEALREREALLRGVAENVPGIVFQVRQLPGQGHQVRFVSNERYLAMFGLHTGLFDREAASLLQQKLVAEDVPAVEKAWESARKKGGQSTVSFRAVSADGHVRWMRAAFEVQVSTLGELLATGVVLDVTAEHRMQEAFERQSRLAAVGQLAAGIAHDFNNVLAVVIGVSERLRSYPLSDEVTDKLGLIAQQGKVAAGLTRKMLDFSRAPESKVQRVGLRDLLRDAVPMLAERTGRWLTIKTDLPEKEIEIEADPLQVEHVLTNLAHNARDASPRRGLLELRLREITVEKRDLPPVAGMSPGRWAALEVADHGSGMSEHVLQHLFEPFFTTKQPGSGSGLGLAQAYGLMKDNGGYIGVASKLGKGTTFTLYFPVAGEV